MIRWQLTLSHRNKEQIQIITGWLIRNLYRIVKKLQNQYMLPIVSTQLIDVSIDDGSLFILFVWAMIVVVCIRQRTNTFLLCQRQISVPFARISPKNSNISNSFCPLQQNFKNILLLSYWHQWHICRRSPRMATRLWEDKHTDFSLIIWDVDFDIFERVPSSIYDRTEVSTGYWYQYAYLEHRYYVNRSPVELTSKIITKITTLNNNQ